MKHILIDFETVQPTTLNSFEAKDTCIWLLLGTQQQQHLPLDLSESLCRFGGNVQFVRVQSSEAGALSAYLALRIGALLTADPTSELLILSANPVYDALTGYIRASLPEANIVRATAFTEVESEGATEQPAAAEAAPAAPQAAAETAAAPADDEAVLAQYYPVIVEAMSQKDAYHPRHRRNLAANIERYLSQYTDSSKRGELADKVIAKLEAENLIRPDGDGTLSYHFPAK